MGLVSAATAAEEMVVVATEKVGLAVGKKAVASRAEAAAESATIPQQDRKEYVRRLLFLNRRREEANARGEAVSQAESIEEPSGHMNLAANLAAT